MVLAATVAIKRHSTYTSTTIGGLCFLRGKSAAGKERLYVCCSYSETLIVPVLKSVARKRLLQILID
jgi:hypothetical protein